MHRGDSYVAAESFEPLERYPLRLTQGDIKANLERLDAETISLDAETQNILMCYRFSPGPLRTCEAVTLLQHAPMSTGLCEKGHAPTRLHKRQHERLEIVNLRRESHTHLHASFFASGNMTRPSAKWSCATTGSCLWQANPGSSPRK